MKGFVIFKNGQSRSFEHVVSVEINIDYMEVTERTPITSARITFPIGQIKEIRFFREQ